MQGGIREPFLVGFHGTRMATEACIPQLVARRGRADLVGAVAVRADWRFEMARYAPGLAVHAAQIGIEDVGVTFLAGHAGDRLIDGLGLTEWAPWQSVQTGAARLPSSRSVA